MSRNFGSSSTFFLRRTALAGAIALSAAAALVASAAPAAAFGSHGGFRSHGGFGGFHHGFTHRFAFDRFHRPFVFGGFGYFPSYAYDDYSADDGCWRRVWGPSGWRLIDVCQ
jgi:hypothetical protein